MLFRIVVTPSRILRRGDRGPSCVEEAAGIYALGGRRTADTSNAPPGPTSIPAVPAGGWHRALMPQHGGCGIRLDSHERGTQSEGASFLIAPVPGRPDLGHVVSHGIDQSDSRVVMVQKLLNLPEVSGLP